jgi:sec-independent protein translocase protein TatC
MWVLFELGVILSRFFVRKRGTDEEAATEAAGTGGPGGAGAPPPAGEPEPSPDGGSGFRPLSEQEMDEELDRIEDEEAAEAQAAGRKGGDESPGGDGGDAVAAEKLRRVRELRERGEDALARELLNDVMAEGDEAQVKVARSILQEMDDGF